MIEGNPKNTIARLQPMKEAKYPKTNVPNNDPNEEIDPTFDKSCGLSGPVTSGVSFDIRTCMEGDSQPTFVPCPIRTKFAAIKLIY